MDIFGIGSAIKAITRVYFRSARQTGRTTALIERVRDGDAIGFTNSREAERVRRLCLGQGKRIECVVFDSNRMEFRNLEGKRFNRLFFDHGLIEQLYMDAIDRTRREIDQCEAQYSNIPLERDSEVTTGVDKWDTWMV